MRECVCDRRILQQAVRARSTKCGDFSFFVVVTVLFADAVLQVCITPSSKPFIRCGSHGTTAAALQGIPFVTATNGASVRVRVCACACHPEHSEGRFQPTPLYFKSTRAAHGQPNSSGTPAANLTPVPMHTRCNIVGTRLCSAHYFHLATPPGFQGNHIPKGNLVQATQIIKFLFFFCGDDT